MENNLPSTNSEEIYNDKYMIQYIQKSFDNIIYYDSKLSNLSYINKNIIHNEINIIYINNNSDENDNN